MKKKFQKSATKTAADLGADCSAQDAFSFACSAHSELYRHNGYSPFMLLYGHEPGGEIAEVIGEPEDNLELTSRELTDVAFRDRVHRRTCARTAWLKAEAEARLGRARLQKVRTTRLWNIGEHARYFGEPRREEEAMCFNIVNGWALRQCLCSSTGQTNTT